jgi:hypothetical protein
MIDIESKIVDTVFNAVLAVRPNADVTTGYDEKTAKFPCVVVFEVDSAPVRSGNTDDCAENYTRLTYEVSVYTDSANNAKTDGKEILEAVDSAMQGLKFRRTRKNRPLNISRTIFRQYARYEVIVGKPVEIDGNTVYQMYRR